MNSDDFMKKHKIDKVYSYLEMMNSSGTMEYGWADDGVLSEGDVVVVSYHSRTKKASSEESKWSKDEGSSVASLSDYKSFFVRSTKFQPDEFLKMHEFSRSALESIWDEMYPNQLEAIDFLYKLAVLIEDGKKFIHAGRGFKIEEV